MAVKNKNFGLGKGLDALFTDNSAEVGTENSFLDINDIEPNREQPRTVFDDDAIAELSASIKQHGVIQPIVVRPMPSGGYKIIAGERRWRASKAAGLAQVPVVIKDISDQEAMEIALIENLQREDLNPVEEALGYKSLLEKHGLTQEEVAKKVAKGRSTVTNALRLLSLPADILDRVSQGEISSGHARALLSFEDFDQMKEAAGRAAKGEINVRELEQLAKASKQAQKKSEVKEKPRSPSFYKEMEIALAAELGRKVRITVAQNKGSLEIEFYNQDDLRALAEKLSEKE